MVEYDLRLHDGELTAAVWYGVYTSETLHAYPTLHTCGPHVNKFVLNLSCPNHPFLPLFNPMGLEQQSSQQKRDRHFDFILCNL